MVANHIDMRPVSQGNSLNNISRVQQTSSYSDGVISNIFNPSTAFILNILGYVSIAPFSNYFLEESSLGGILINFFISAFTIITFILHCKKLKPIQCKHIIFGLLFLVIYAVRLCVETFVDGTLYPTGNIVVLTYFFVNTGLLVPLITLMSWQLSDRQTYNTILALSAIFLVGMFLNLSVLQDSASHRLNLDKVNPISMAHLSVSFMVAFLVFFKRSIRSQLIAAILCFLLFYIFVFARTRSAYLAPIVIWVFYFLSQRGRRRILMVLGAAIITPIGISLTNPDIRDIIVNRVLYTLSGEDQSTEVRLHLISGALEFFTKNMFFGKSILEPTQNFYPHNIILEALISTGLMGTILLLTHLAVSLWAAFNILRSRAYPKYVELVVLLHIQHMLTSLISGAIWGLSALWGLSYFVIYVYYGRVKVVKTRFS